MNNEPELPPALQAKEDQDNAALRDIAILTKAADLMLQAYRRARTVEEFRNGPEFTTMARLVESMQPLLDEPPAPKRRKGR